eukprot:GEMP01036957.1.p1 GENE.GEMP01036957.1~~GEMP01036957.1.p1  ORF type:complete len:290 (+),score=50.31 GEMP01036957.1:26-871(+)
MGAPVILAIGGVWATYNFGKYRFLVWRQRTVNEWLDAAMKNKMKALDEDESRSVIPSQDELLRRARGKCAACLRPLWLRATDAPAGKGIIHSVPSLVYLKECKCYLHERCFFETSRDAWGVSVMPWNSSFYTEQNLDPANVWELVKRLFRGENQDAVEEDFECPRCKTPSKNLCSVQLPESSGSLVDRLSMQRPESISEEELRALLKAHGGPQWRVQLDSEDGDEWIKDVGKHDPGAFVTLCPATCAIAKRFSEGDGHIDDAARGAPTSESLQAYGDFLLF